MRCAIHRGSRTVKPDFRWLALIRRPGARPAMPISALSRRSQHARIVILISTGDNSGQSARLVIRLRTGPATVMSLKRTRSVGLRLSVRMRLPTVALATRINCRASLPGRRRSAPDAMVKITRPRQSPIMRWRDSRRIANRVMARHRQLGSFRDTSIPRHFH